MEAASQLQALVFSQLGALAHSMLEFGCGAEMTSVFVRRMSIRHQLPISQRMVLLKHVLEKNECVDSDLHEKNDNSEEKGDIDEKKDNHEEKGDTNKKIDNPEEKDDTK